MGTVGRGPRCIIRSVEGHDPYRCGHCAAVHASTAPSSSENIQTYTCSDMLLQVVLTVETYLRAFRSSRRVSIQLGGWQSMHMHVIACSNILRSHSYAKGFIHKDAISQQLDQVQSSGRPASHRHC